MNNIKKIACLFLLALVLIFQGCGGAAGSPDFLTPEASDLQGDGPEVNEELATEAWQQRLVYHVGPVDLPASTAPMLEAPVALRFQTDEPIWVQGFVPRVVDADGAELPPALLHQVIISNMHEENPLCSGGGNGNPIFVATSLMTEIEFPEGFGYPILSTDPIDAQVVFANPTEQSYAGVTFELTLVARPMSEAAEIADVRAMLVEPDPCTHVPLKIEPGSFAEKSATYSMAQAGKVVLAHGALQSYGAAVELTAGSELAPFWRAEAELDEARNMLGLTDNPFVDPEGVSLAQGDALTLGVTYDNVSEQWLDGATAAAMVYVVPAE